jgi:hypothetical protein
MTWILGQLAKPFGFWLLMAAVVVIFGAGVAAGRYSDAVSVVNAKTETAKIDGRCAKDTANANAAGAGAISASAGRSMAADDKTNKDQQKRKAGYGAALENSNHVPTHNFCPKPSIDPGPLRTLVAGMRDADAGTAASADRDGVPRSAVDDLSPPR